MIRSIEDSCSPGTLLGLSAEETDEFLRLERLASTAPGAADHTWSATEQTRWLELFEKKHAAAMQPFLAPEDAEG
ncbi:hypothetical protein FIU28_16750 [Tardiphaga sp. vice154]|nr:hypothetical protein FIU28_16750 [Tardiphaga sp. vice154]